MKFKIIRNIIYRPGDERDRPRICLERGLTFFGFTVHLEGKFAQYITSEYTYQSPKYFITRLLPGQKVLYRRWVWQSRTLHTDCSSKYQKLFGEYLPHVYEEFEDES